jgi:hypothetical protein
MLNGWRGGRMTRSCPPIAESASVVARAGYRGQASGGRRRLCCQPTLDASHFADNAASHAAYAAMARASACKTAGNPCWTTRSSRESFRSTSLPMFTPLLPVADIVGHRPRQHCGGITFPKVRRPVSRPGIAALLESPWRFGAVDPDQTARHATALSGATSSTHEHRTCTGGPKPRVPRIALRVFAMTCMVGMHAPSD